MTLEETLEYWRFKHERAKNYTDDHWEADERRAHEEYVEAMQKAVEAIEKQMLVKLKDEGRKLKAMNNAKELIKLMIDNPELPVVAFVDGDIVGDDSSVRWIGEMGSCRVGEYALFNDRYYDDRDDLKEVYFGYYYEELKRLSTGELETVLDEKTSGMWVKAILVNIDTLS